MNEQAERQADRIRAMRGLSEEKGGQILAEVLQGFIDRAESQWIREIREQDKVPNGLRLLLKQVRYQAEVEISRRILGLISAPKESKNG